MYHFSRYLRWKKLLLEHHWVVVLFVFCLAAAFYTLLNNIATFVDPDSFYHVAMTEVMMRHKDVIVSFPWLPFTTLADAFVDHHMLYHLFLIPFSLLFGSFVGMKVATVLLASIVTILLYIILRALNVRSAFVWTLLALFAEPFSFRMALAKAPSVGAFFLFAGLYLLITRRFSFLAILSFFFVWAYGGFLLLLVLVGVYVAWEGVHTLQMRREGKQTLSWMAVFSPFLFTISGMGAGLLIHPAFPNHFRFYWQQIVQIGFVNYHSIIGVGSEWYPASFVDVLLNAPIVNALFFIGCIFFIARFRRQTSMIKTLFCMAWLFLFFTLKSQRYVEYSLPWSLLFAAAVWKSSGAQLWCVNLAHIVYVRFFTIPMFHRIIIVLAVLYGGIMVPSLLLRDGKTLVYELHQGIPLNRFDRAGAWLRSHGTRGDIVFHNDWDDFPILMYQAPKLRFIVGLDPTFFYRRNSRFYWQWVNITTGVQSDRLLETIQKDFGARFVFVDREHERMRENIVADGRMKNVYEDDEVTIFRVPRE